MYAGQIVHSMSRVRSDSNVGGSRKRPDQPCSSSSLQSKCSRENSDIGGEYSSPCSPFHMSLNPVLQFLHLSSQCSTV